METIKGFDNYEIDREGNVWSKKRNKFMKPYCSGGYLRVDLHKKKGERTRFLLHRLLALQFIDNPDNLPCVDHIDRNKQNNSLENLRWVTVSQNVRNRDCKGYSFNKRSNKYKATYMLNYKYIHIGYYDTEEEARVAYLNAIKDL
tara:strand:+ start:52 stop:486 length:435 start_codon:yes stop_codon:yes gene_type:complete